MESLYRCVRERLRELAAEQGPRLEREAGYIDPDRVQVTGRPWAGSSPGQEGTEKRTTAPPG